MNLGDNNLQWILDKRGMTQKNLHELTGIHQSDISEIIAGKKKRLTLVSAAKISNALGYSIESIWPKLFKF